MFAGSGTILETGRQAQNLEFAGHCKITSKPRKTVMRAERYLLSSVLTKWSKRLGKWRTSSNRDDTLLLLLPHNQIKDSSLPRIPRGILSGWSANRTLKPERTE
jgi:hypothetical protein